MLYRNLLALEVEELLRSHPIDGVVLMGGCDKTTPATLMGAISMNLPAIFLPAGPMLRGNYAGKPLGSGSDVWKYWADKQAGMICRGGMARRWRPASRVLRHLHDHGHGLDDDGARRDARLDAARRLVDSGRRLRPMPAWRPPAAGGSSR